jgi:hypothetical protein
MPSIRLLCDRSDHLYFEALSREIYFETVREETCLEMLSDFFLSPKDAFSNIIRGNTRREIVQRNVCPDISRVIFAHGFRYRNNVRGKYYICGNIGADRQVMAITTTMQITAALAGDPQQWHHHHQQALGNTAVGALGASAVAPGAVSPIAYHSG